MLSLLSASASAADYHVGPDGSSASVNSSCTNPSSVEAALSVVEPGDHVIFCDGVYEAPIQLTRSGSADRPITLRAEDNAIPIVRGSADNDSDGLFSHGRVTDIVIDGLWFENWRFAGIGLDYRACDDDDLSLAVENITIRNCVVDSNGLNGISAYMGTGYVIENNIVSRNGWGEDSWSSNINLYGVTGTNNTVRGNIAFHGIDTSENHSDGNGFILDLTLDRGSARFEDNVGFFNGGACISVTDAGGAQLVNNSCYQNVQDPNAASHIEEFNLVDTCRGQVSCIDVANQSWTFSGLALTNNVAAARDGKSGLNAHDSCANTNPTVAGSGNEIGAGDGGFANPDGLDFSRAGTAGSRLAYDPRCIHEASGRLSWWTHAPDLDYIRSIGGIRNCFTPGETTCSAGNTPCNGICVDLGKDKDNCGGCGATCGEGEACNQGACTAPAGQFTVDEETGYVSVCEWGGFAWTSAGPEAPGLNATVSSIEETAPLCYAGIVAAHEGYSGYAMLGLNINQTGGEQAPAQIVTPTGDGLNIDLTNRTEATLRVQLQDELGGEDEDHRWCVEVEGSGGFFPWSAFNTKCWDASGNAYAMEPISVIAVMVAGHNANDVEFDFCLDAFAPSGATCDDPPGGGDTEGPACEPPRSSCASGSCVDLASDPNHCGSCDSPCDESSFCSNSVCADSCDSGLSPCGQACVDLSSDLLHCGGCSIVCSPGQRCESSECVEASDSGGNEDPDDEDTESSGTHGSPASTSSQGAGCACSTGGHPAGNAPFGVLVFVGLLGLRRRPRQRWAA